MLPVRYYCKRLVSRFSLLGASNLVLFRVCFSWKGGVLVVDHFTPAWVKIFGLCVFLMLAICADALTVCKTHERVESIYRPSPVKLSPPKNRYFAARDNFEGVVGTTFALPASHQNGHPPTVREIVPPFCRTRYCPHLTSPRGDNFKGVGGGAISRGRVGTRNKIRKSSDI